MAALMVVSGAVLIILSYHLWDIPVAYYCRGLSRSVLDIAEIVTRAGDSKWYFMMFVPAFLIFYFIVKNKIWAMRMLFLVICISASGIVNMLVKWIAGRNRPINLFNHGFYGFNYFEVIYESVSFPSGHSLTAFSLAAAVTILYPRAGIIAFPAAIAIATSRVMITSHFVSDVIAGAVLGTICTLAVKYYFDRRKITLTGTAGES
jgi:membrane-associated phospholipid phosphatase